MMATTPMRIAHFLVGRCNPDSANGIDKTIYFLSRSQAALGHEVAVYSLSDKAAVPIPGVDMRSFHPVLGRTSRISPVPSMLKRDLVRWKPHIVHLHFVYSPQNVSVAKHVHRVGIPYCVTLHGGLAVASQGRNRLRKLAFKYLMERAYLEQAAFLHAISQHDVDGLRLYGARNDILVCPNGMDAKSLPPPSNTSELLARHPQLTNRRIVLFVGRVDPTQKGLDLLIRGFAAAEVPGVVLVVVGPSWRGGAASLSSLVTRLGLDDRVLFPGPAFGADKTAWLSIADLFAHTSRWEAGVPFAVLEAAAYGVPLLITPHADSSGLMAARGAAISVDASESSIAEGIRSFFVLDSVGSSAMAAAARSAVCDEFDWSRIAARIVDQYRMCVNEEV